MYSSFAQVIKKLEAQGFKFSNPPSKWYRRANMRECSATKHGINYYVVRIWIDQKEKEYTVEIFKLEEMFKI